MLRAFVRLMLIRKLRKTWLGLAMILGGSFIAGCCGGPFTNAEGGCLTCSDPLPSAAPSTSGAPASSAEATPRPDCDAVNGGAGGAGD